LRCIEGDENVEGENCVEEGFAACGGDRCGFDRRRERWWVSCDIFCGGEEGGDGRSCDDVEKWKERVDEADFFVGY